MKVLRAALTGAGEHDGESEEFRKGVESVLRIRCVEHRFVVSYNASELAGGECAACAVNDVRATGRWTLEELRELEREWSGGVNYPASRFLDSLEAS